MSDELAFDKYKSVVDYITSNTGQISASLQTLIKNTLATRSDSVLNIVSSGSAVKKINVGSIQIDFETGTWKSIAPIKVDFSESGELNLNGTGDMPLNALLSLILTDGEIEEISKTFVTKTNVISEVFHYYSPSVDSFSGNDVPSLQDFFSNYYSISDVELDKHVVISSRDVNDDNNVVTYSIGNILSGAKKSDKLLNTATKVISSNLFYANDSRVELKADMEKVSISGETSIANARSNKSLVLQDMLPMFIVYKDLRNIQEFSMQEPQEDDMNFVGTPVYLDELMSEKKKVLQKSIDITQNTINGLTTNFLASSYSSFGTGAEIECFSDVLKYNAVETALRGNKQDDGGIGASASSILTDLSSSSGSARNRAVSVKTLYSMISATLSTLYPDIMINAAEKLALSSQLGLIIQEDDQVFGARPIISIAEEVFSEIATFEYIEISVGAKEISVRDTTFVSWTDYV